MSAEQAARTELENALKGRSGWSVEPPSSGVQARKPLGGSRAAVVARTKRGHWESGIDEGSPTLSDYGLTNSAETAVARLYRLGIKGL